MQKAELRVADTRTGDVSPSRPVGHDIGHDEDATTHGRRAKRLALLLMATSSLFMIGLLAALWLIWGPLL